MSKALEFFMENEVRIRKFEEGDAEALVAIERESFPEANVWSKGYFLKLWRSMPEWFLVAEETDAGKELVLGFLVGREKDGEAELASMAVLAAARGKGVGKKLLESFVDLAGEAGFRKMILRVRASNEAAAELYKKFGFQVEDVLEGYYNGGEDALLMSLEIG